MQDLNRVLRPKSWTQVVGQGAVKEICQKAISENKFPKFSIFHGPTGVGKSCIAEMIAAQLINYTGNIEECPNIKKYNMASLVGKKDIIEIIEDIFKFKSAGTTVYILEEVQILRQKEEQAPFLEELTKIPDNVYIMMCTTRVSALLPEMRNRAILFQLYLPSMEECKSYIDSILNTLHFGKMSDRSKEVLIKFSNFTPRSIVKHIELLSSGSIVDETDLNKLFNTIEVTSLIEALAVLTDSNISLYECMNRLKPIIKSNSFFYELNDFAAQILLEKASSEELLPLTSKERDQVNTALAHIDESTFVRLFDALGKMDFYKLENSKDCLVALIKIKVTLMNKTPQSIISSNSTMVSEAIIANKRSAHKAMPDSKPAPKTIKPLDSDTSLLSFGVEDSTYYE